MKQTKRLILISLLLLLLAGAFLLDPLARFALTLQTKQFDHAEAVYLSRLCHSDQLRQDADEKLQAKLAQAKAAREAAFSQQKNLNTEIAEAMRRRMGERRADTPEERAKRGPVPAPRSAAERIRLPGPPPPEPEPDAEKAAAEPPAGER